MPACSLVPHPSHAHQLSLPLFSVFAKSRVVGHMKTGRDMNIYAFLIDNDGIDMVVVFVADWQNKRCCYILNVHTLIFFLIPGRHALSVTFRC